MVLFVVDGQPVGKGRPKFTRQGKFVHTYTPEKTRSYEELVRWSYKRYVGDGSFFEKDIPLNVQIQLYYQIPQSTSKRKTEEMQSGLIRPCVKSDLDNCIKIIMDALNGLAWDDDKQVCEISCCKHYSSKPRAEIMISEC